MRNFIFLTVFFSLTTIVLSSQGAAQTKAPAAPAAGAAKPATAATPQARPAAAAPRPPAVDVKALTAELEKLKGEQAKAQEQKKADEANLVKAQQTVQEWFRRWNALDGSDESINRFLELHQADALLMVGPPEDQIGLVFYEGQDEIRRMAKDLSDKYTRLAYYIKVRTVSEKTSDLLFASPTPWGGVSVTTEFGGSKDFRDTGKRLMVPGAAFFDIQEGKIKRLRIYYARGETAEIVGSFNANCGN